MLKFIEGDRMRFLNFALGVAAGMAVNAAKNVGYKEQRAHELNMQGVRLANAGYYSDALSYFSEAHKLMPRELTIKNNILQCKQALRKIEEEKKLQAEYKRQQEKEKLERLRRNKVSKKPKAPEKKFPKETENYNRSGSKWCDGCCTYVPKDSEYCPYCGHIFF